MLEFIITTYSGGILWILLSLIIILKIKKNDEFHKSDFLIRALNIICVCFFMILGVGIISIKLYSTFH